MSDTFSKVEVITSIARRRRFSTDLKLAVVAESCPASVPMRQNGRVEIGRISVSGGLTAHSEGR